MPSRDGGGNADEEGGEGETSPPPPHPASSSSSSSPSALWHGLGLFGESYLLFSVGTLRPMWSKLYDDESGYSCSSSSSSSSSSYTTYSTTGEYY